MKGRHDKIYIASSEDNWRNPDESEFDLLLTEPP